ncbi:hypothetical protein LWI29_022550 [Acer saccharum]|uniref:ABC transporter domain-containing protein n=1 Tax=Acer saccharum TaxID=4024 RepID=A0AA39W6S5_ACESA|nr:hypothetical protein LWI29_022550 [Acer saccharum]
MAASNGSEYFEYGIEAGSESFSRPSNAETVEEDEAELMWEALSRLPSQKQSNFALLRRTPSEFDDAGGDAKIETVDVRKLSRSTREFVVKEAFATNDQDNYRLVSKIKERLDRVGLEVPKVEVRFENLKVVADVQTGSRALPTLINVTRDTIEKILTGLRIFRPDRHKLTILHDINGAVKPGRMTLLLGPPGSGKSTLLLALAGKLDSDLKTSGNITYNGHQLDEFHVQRTSAYTSQTDNHIAELTVRETLDFGARFQGSSEVVAGYMKDLIRLEKEKNIRPSPEIDAFMKASSVPDKKHSVSTDYVLKVLGLDVCSDTIVGNDMLRGVSGGQRKRVTTGEMIVGPRKTLFMDEISTGLDSSTTYQIVNCVRNVVHQMDATVLMALLQPAPETFDLFDDLVLLSEGYVVYQGPRADALEFFESLGFKLSPRKGVADFLQEKSAIGNNTVGYNILQANSLPSGDNWYWIGVGVLLLYSLLFNGLVTIALAYLNPLRTSRTVIPLDAEEENSAGEGVTSQKSESNTKSYQEGGKKKGMILPFQPLAMTFQNVNYFVDMPKAMSSKGVPEKKLQLLSNVSGVFSPGVLTALVGSSGAGKTTLMDVLAGRKTGGYIEGDIKISGHPKEQSTFARIAGYVEQNDIHSPQVTVEESLMFSSSLRLPKEVGKDQRKEFVEEVMSLVELDTLRHALVGLPGSSGLSTEQRKRLTIAVELVANPSIIFMDEPTSGLDARAAAIVMRTVRNTVDTGRTVVCTIHQPSIDIFEAFDEGIIGITPIPSGYNPATWMLEVTTPAVEARLGVEFADLYSKSDQYREVEYLIKELSIPPAGSQPLKFASMYSKDQLSQFLICLWKQNLVYWRSPQYNAMRLCFTTIAALIFGSVFWDIGSKRDSTQALFMVMGALYSSCLFIGINNASSVQPIVSIERTVFYRERAAGMYSPFAYAAAQGIVEIPYILVQTIIYGIITYYMVNFERTATKFSLFIVFMFLTFTYFTFYGMMAVGLTPNQHLAAVISSAFYSLWNLVSGFLVPKPSIPGWWIWFYYICPVAWTMRGVITSQLGDVETIIEQPGIFKGSVKEYLDVNLGYGPGMIGVSAAVLVAFCHTQEQIHNSEPILNEENEEVEEYEEEDFENYNLTRDRTRRTIKPPQRYGYADIVAYALHVAGEVTDEPKNYQDAVTRKDYRLWVQAMDEEFQSL